MNPLQMAIMQLLQRGYGPQLGLMEKTMAQNIQPTQLDLFGKSVGNQMMGQYNQMGNDVIGPSYESPQMNDVLGGEDINLKQGPDVLTTPYELPQMNDVISPFHELPGQDLFGPPNKTLPTYIHPPIGYTGQPIGPTIESSETPLQPTPTEGKVVSKNPELQKAFDNAMSKIPEDMRKDINIKGLRQIEFPEENQGEGGRLERDGKGNHWIFVEKGEANLEDAILHEAVHSYVFKHPEIVKEGYFGMEDAVNKITKQLSTPTEGKVISFNELPDAAKGALQAEMRVKITNEGFPVKEAIRQLEDKRFIEVDYKLSDIRRDNPDIFADTFTKRGSVTKGAITIDDSGKVVDGNNRVREAFERGEESIRAFLEIPKTK